MATAIVTARVPVQVRAALKSRADRAGRTLSDEIRLALLKASENTNDDTKEPHASFEQAA